MSAKVNLILRGASLRIMQAVVGIVIGLFQMPFLIATLGTNQYGLWILVGSIVGTYYLLDLGFNQAVTRYVSKYIHQDNPLAANKVINTALVLYSILGVLVLGVSILAALVGVELLIGPGQDAGLAKKLLIIAGISLAIEFPAKAFTGIIDAYMRYDVTSTVRFSKSILDALLFYVFLIHGCGLVAMSLITLCTGVMSTAIFAWYTTWLFKDLKINRALVDVATVKDIFHFSKWIFILDVNSMLRLKMDIWFISYYLTTSLLTVYYVAVRLIEYAVQLLTRATGITGPIFTEFYAKKQFDKLEMVFVLFYKINFIFSIIVIIGLGSLGENLISVWMKGAVDPRLTYNCLIILAVGRLIAYLNAPVVSLLLTINKHKLCSHVSLVETIFTAIASWILIPRIGIVGAAISIAAPHLIQLLVLPVFAARQLNIKLLAPVIRLCFYVFIGAGLWLYVIPTYIGISADTYKAIFSTAFLISCSLLCASIIAFDRKERDWIFGYIKSKLIRR